MKFPDCFYSKAFWIIIPILILSFSSGVVAINLNIDAIEERTTQNEIKLAIFTEPISLIPDIYKNQIIICEKLQANCN